MNYQKLELIVCKVVFVSLVIIAVACLLWVNLAAAESRRIELDDSCRIEVAITGEGAMISWDCEAVDGCNYSVIVEKIQGAGQYKKEFIAWDQSWLLVGFDGLGSTGFYLVKLYCNGQFISSKLFAFDLVILH